MPDFVPQKIEYTNSICIDWLRFSLPVETATQVWSFLGFSLHADDWQETTANRKKYRLSLLDGVNMFTDGIPVNRYVGTDYEKIEVGISGKRFLVDFSGSGLSSWHTAHGDTALDLIKFFKEIHSDARVSRIDVAYDDHQNLMNLRKVTRYALKTNLMVTRWKTAQLLTSHDLSKESDELGNKGTTLYIGDRGSQSFCRVYDKRKQEMYRGAVETDLPEHWTRLELEYKGKRSNELAIQLMTADDPSIYLSEILRGQLDFKAPTSSQKAIKNRPPAHWWSRFLNGCAKRPLRTPRDPQTIKRKKEWLEASVSATLATVLEYEEQRTKDTLVDGREAYLDKLLLTGENKMTNLHRALLNGHSS